MSVSKSVEIQLSTKGSYGIFETLDLMVQLQHFCRCQGEFGHFTMKSNYLSPARNSQDIISWNIKANMSVALVDSFDLELQGNKTT